LFPWISDLLSPTIGAFRLLRSDMLLMALGSCAAFFVTVLGIPRVARWLPRDRGRAFAVDADKSVGKPMGAGLFFVAVFALAVFLFLPWRLDVLLFVGVMLLASGIGLVDDATGGLSEYQLAFFDFLVAGLSAWLLVSGEGTIALWLPLISGSFELPSLAVFLIFTAVIWISINATNCSDGVDGLSGSLSVVSLVFLAFLLYGVVGDKATAGYLLIPFDPRTGLWASLAIIMVGGVAGYLWHNAPPSSVLMGDAGSRPLGLLIGMLVCASHNVLLIVVVGLVILANGATGIAKLALKRFFNVLVLGRVRFPLHDHFRKEVGWTGSQVLVRFVIAHLIVSALLYALLLKVR
jgi:phospho-N-acetylmuramoyl-pentapeptide-transferase